jgi:hypothetical protein
MQIHILHNRLIPDPAQNPTERAGKFTYGDVITCSFYNLSKNSLYIINLVFTKCLPKILAKFAAFSVVLAAITAIAQTKIMNLFS